MMKTATARAASQATLRLLAAIALVATIGARCVACAGAARRHARLCGRHERAGLGPGRRARTDPHYVACGRRRSREGDDARREAVARAGRRCAAHGAGTGRARELPHRRRRRRSRRQRARATRMARREGRARHHDRDRLLLLPERSESGVRRDRLWRRLRDLRCDRREEAGPDALARRQPVLPEARLSWIPMRWRRAIAASVRTRRFRAC